MITITHTHADGTLISGSSKGDGVYDVLRGLRANWRYFPSISQIGLGQSRDRNAQEWKIERAAEALRAAGHEVTVEIDESQRRSFAEAEAERCDRAEGRAERFGEYAGNAAARSDAAYAKVRQIADGIPMGQPILVGHHSEGRHRRDLKRMDDGMRKSVGEGKKAEHYAHRAELAERYRDHRESIPTTLRRIDKLEAEERRVQRELNGTPGNRNTAFAADFQPASGAYRERLLSTAADLADEIAYWRGIVAAAEQNGVKLWSAADFTKGDYVAMRGSGRWYLVERVNPKSLTVPTGNNLHDLVVVTRANVFHAMGPSQWTHKLPYEEVAGRKSAADMAEVMAEVERRRAEAATA